MKKGAPPRESGGPSRETPLLLAGAEVEPGGRAYLEIPVAQLVTGTGLGIPVCALHGARPGPTLWISAAVHGDEINGVEIIRRVLARVDERRLAGTVLAVPIVNVFGFLEQSRYLPDRRDLNRSFPGTLRGSLAARIAHLFLTEIVERCDYGVDIHTASLQRTNLPQIRANLDDEHTLRLARCFGTDVILASKPRSGSLRAEAVSRGISNLLYEAGEAHRFNRTPIRVGVRGVLAVLNELGMGDFREDASPGSEPFLAKGSEWIRAPRSGILHLDVAMGARVSPRQVLGELTDAFGRDPRKIRARRAGLVIGHTVSPLLNRGDAAVHVAYAGED